MILGILGIHAFNLIDTFFVGQLGTRELAAMSFTFPVVFTIAGMALGLGLGASAVISRAIGEGDWHKVRRLTTDSLTLSWLIVAFLVVVGLLTIDPVFRLLGATDEFLPLIRQYMRIWYPGAAFVVIPMVGNNAIRATGDTKTPSLIMLVAVCANGLIDPFLIFGWGPFPRLELAGAALATIIGRSITFTVALWVLGRREKMLTRRFPGVRAVWESWKSILYIGVPSGLVNVAIPVGLGIITRLVSGYGAAAVAGFGVASRVETFALTPIGAVRSVVAPFVGQNWGACRHDRVRRGVALSQRFALAWGVLLLVVFAIVGSRLATLFNDDPAVVRNVALYLWIVPLSYGLKGVFQLSTAGLAVLRRPLDAALLTALQIFGLYVPLGILGSHILGLTGVFGAAAVANLVTGFAAYFWLKRVMAMRERCDEAGLTE
jgi:putative MATE family efflux protein